MTSHSSAPLRAVAILEASKGLLVIIAGIGVFSFIHQSTHDYIQYLASHVHWNPARSHPRIFLDYAEQFADKHLAGLALLAALYSTVRFIEAYGLWYCRHWAEWFAAISGSIYIPFEIYEVFSEKNLTTLVILLVNIFIVGIMINELRRRKTTTV